MGGIGVSGDTPDVDEIVAFVAAMMLRMLGKPAFRDMIDFCPEPIRKKVRSLRAELRDRA